MILLIFACMIIFASSTSLAEPLNCSNIGAGSSAYLLNPAQGRELLKPGKKFTIKVQFPMDANTPGYKQEFDFASTMQYSVGDILVKKSAEIGAQFNAKLPPEAETRGGEFWTWITKPDLIGKRILVTTKIEATESNGGTTKFEMRLVYVRNVLAGLQGERFSSLIVADRKIAPKDLLTTESIAEIKSNQIHTIAVVFP